MPKKNQDTWRSIQLSQKFSKPEKEERKLHRSSGTTDPESMKKARCRSDFRFDATFSEFFLRILLDGSDGMLMVGLVGFFGWVFFFVFFLWLWLLGVHKDLNFPAM